jgi:rare lipoprotein A
MIALDRPSAAGRNLALVLLAAASLAACATPGPRYSARLPDAGGAAPPSGAGGAYKVGKPYQVGGIWYVPREDPNYDVKGVASWYGDQFHMKRTANGETFDMHALSAAHPTLPLPSIVEVTNLENGRSLRVRVNDRGPFVDGRVIDMSRAAAQELGFHSQGLARVRVKYVGPAPLGDSRMAAAPQRPAPIAPPPVQQMAAAPVAAPKSEPVDVAWTAPGPAAITQTALAPLAAAPPPINPPDRRVIPMAPQPERIASTGGYRIQAGSFGDLFNAQKAVDALSRGGARAAIEPVDLAGSTLYRVIVESGPDENEAWAMRDMVAGYGFADARVIRPF